MANAKSQLKLSRKIPAAMKVKIEKHLNSSSTYNNGIITGLTKPDGMSKISKKISSVSFGADKNGFFVYTHRARSKSYVNPLKITKKWIDWIESTG